MINTTISIVVIGAVVYLSYRYLVGVYDYWKNKNVPGPTPIFLLGNMAEVAKGRKTFFGIIASYYNEYPEEKFVGMYQGRSPMLIIRDVDDIKQVLIKDFANFRNRGLLVAEAPLSKNLFHADDETWHLLRQKLAPIFTSGKLKGMFHLMNECAEQFQQYLEHLVQKNAEPEIRQLMAKFTLEVFGSCVFGIDMRTLSDDDNVFRDMGTKIFRPSQKMLIGMFFDSIFPGIIRKLNIKLHNPEIALFFTNLVRELIKERAGKPIVRKDFMDLMLELKEHGHITGGGFGGHKQADLEITELLMAAQAVTFYAAGFEASSGTMAFLFHELALHQDIQEKVYQEICEVTNKNNGLLTYDGIQEMTYLDMVLAETLRKYPLSGVLIRQSSSDYTFPGNKFTIDKGVKVVIPVYALHSDPQYFPDPDKFDPERFSPENKRNIQQCTYLPFGEGPRNCIGLRFAKVQSMVGVASFLQKYRLVPSSKTKPKLRYSPKTIALESADGIWMKIEKRYTFPRPP